MRHRSTHLLLLGIAMVVAGCGGDTVNHDDADKLLIEGNNVSATDPAAAIDFFTKAIEAKPTEHAYYRRGWLYARQNEDAKAKADVAEGLKLAPEHHELNWLASELKKPAAQRKLDMPPAATK